VRVSSRFALVTHQNGCSLIPRGLVLEEMPGCGVRLEPALLAARELGLLSLFKAVDAGFLRRSASVGGDTSSPHAPAFGEISHPADVDLAPDAAGTPGCEPNAIAGAVDAFPYAVDPAETQRFVYSLRPREAGLA
jgi:hypothetical protein